MRSSLIAPLVLLAACSGARLQSDADDGRVGALMPGAAPSEHALAIARCNDLSYTSSNVEAVRACVVQANDAALPVLRTTYERRYAGQGSRVDRDVQRYRSEVGAFFESLLESAIATSSPTMAPAEVTRTRTISDVTVERTMARAFDGFAELGGAKSTALGLEDVEMTYPQCFLALPASRRASVAGDCVRIQVLKHAEIQIPAIAQMHPEWNEHQVAVAANTLVSNAIDAGTVLCQTTVAVGGYADFDAVLKAEGECRMSTSLALDTELSIFFPPKSE